MYTPGDSTKVSPESRVKQLLMKRSDSALDVNDLQSVDLQVKSQNEPQPALTERKSLGMSHFDPSANNMLTFGKYNIDSREED